jgi:TatD DNase family protein
MIIIQKIYFMIDTHCHLEQPDYNSDRDEVIKKCEEAGLKAIVTCCAHPNDFDLTMKIVEKHKGFVFATYSIHPEYIKEISEKRVKEYFNLLRNNSKKIIAIGETGLDFHWIKESDWRERQKELFIEHIKLARELVKPLVIHARDSFQEAIEILEQENAKQVQMHMFGAHHLLKRVIDNGWFISINTILLRSKKHKKIIRDAPLERILLETDAPWLSPTGGRNDPTSIKVVAEKVAEIKKISLDEVWLQCGRNALEFFKLPIKLK